MNHTYTLSLSLSLTVGSLLAASTVEAAPVCYDFAGDAGTQQNPWSVCPGSVFTCFNFHDERPSATDNEVEDLPPEALWIRGSGADYRIDFSLVVMSPPSFYPTRVEFELGVFSQTVDVEAYDPSDQLLWSDAYSATDWHTVTIDENAPIAYVTIDGGNNETYVDSICME